MNYRVITGCCLDILPTLDSGSVDMVLTDLPYGKTRNSWDRPIPFEPMWAELRRVCKPQAAMVFTATEPFGAQLICSNLADFRYDLVWSKNKPTGFLNAKKQPLRSHENILVFYRKPPLYSPQMTSGHKPGNYARCIQHSTNYGKQTPTEYGGSTKRYPKSVIEIPIINNDDPEKFHPTQKPVDLMRWLIRTYTSPGDLVLDIAAGSGSTGVAAMLEGRRSICIELETEYASAADLRILETTPELAL